MPPSRVLKAESESETPIHYNQLSVFLEKHAAHSQAPEECKCGWAAGGARRVCVQRGADQKVNSKTIMLNKYGLNVGAAYVEQSTLLEPNNFIPSWEAGDEEKKEVSNVLRQQRQRYDKIHQKVMEKEKAFELLKVSAPPTATRSSARRKTWPSASRSTTT